MSQFSQKAESTASVLKTAAIAVPVVAATGTGLFLGIRYFVRKAREQNAGNNALDPQRAEALALQLKMAFENDNSFGWGTNDDAVFDAFNRMPTQEFYQDVIRAYSKLYPGRSLTKDLADEMDSAEMAKVIQILNSKPAK